MLRKNLCEMILRFPVIPKGPILIKSGTEGAADPTLPDMNFVRTIHPKTGEQTVYLPGSSQKGLFRSYAEKIARTVFDDRNFDKIPDIVTNPNHYQALYQERYGKDASDWEIYSDRDYDPVSKLFGSQVFASRIRFKDAFPAPGADVNIEQRTNVSINRILQKVQAGPFNMEVVTSGKFIGQIVLRNFELWQVGLLGLVFRDLDGEMIKLGFAKSRGLGDVHVPMNALEIDIFYSKPNYEKTGKLKQILGLDSLLSEQERKDYRIFGNDPFDPLNLEVETVDPDGWGVRLQQAIRGEDVRDLFKACVTKHWAKLVEQEPQNGR
jgi:CRISPR/Cas system CSM-associated protein Csm3 (group 7 of RAMP superfamily)